MSRLRPILVTILTLTWAVAGYARDRALRGCPDLALIAKALTKVQRSDWRDMSVRSLQALWPNKLYGVDCNNEACSSVESRGRIIDGRYECSELFFFDLQQVSGASPTEQLNNLIIHYSTTDRGSSVSAAKVLARSIGLPENQVATVGNEPDQDFSWDDSQGQGAGLKVKLTHEAPVWTIYLNFSRHPT